MFSENSLVLQIWHEICFIVLHKTGSFYIFHLCKENKRKELLGEKMVMVLIVVLGIAFLLLLVLKCKLHAFIALLIASIAVGVAAGMPLTDITASIQNGMGGTLGTVAS
mgnify:CR=1 FL=1